MKVTADDRAMAGRLLEAFHSPFAADKKAIAALAQLISDITERAVSCAVVRVEREFVLKARKRVDATERQGTDNTGEKC